MNDPWTRPPGPDEGGGDGPDDPGGPDPGLAFELRSMAPPEHGPRFWEELDARLDAEGAGASAPGGPPPAPPAEIVPLAAAPRSGPPRALLGVLAAAALVLVVAVGALLTTGGTDLETATPVTVATLPLPTTATTATPSTTAAVPTTRPAVTPTTVARPTTTAAAKADPFVVSPGGLGALRFGMTSAQAKATGVVEAMTVDELAPDGSCGFARPAGIYRSTDFGALYLGGKLVRLYVAQGSRLRTPQGIASGSPETKLSSVPGTRYELPHPYQEAARNVYVMSGDVGYQFTVVGGLVTEWSAGTKDGLDTPEGCA